MVGEFIFQLLVTSRSCLLPVYWGGGRVGETALVLCQHCSSVAKTCYVINPTASNANEQHYEALMHSQTQYNLCGKNSWDQLTLGSSVCGSPFWTLKWNYVCVYMHTTYTWVLLCACVHEFLIGTFNYELCDTVIIYQS